MRKIRFKSGSILLLTALSAFLLVFGVPHVFDDNARDKLAEEVRSLRARLRYTELRMIDKQNLINDVLFGSASNEVPARSAKRQRLPNRTSLRLPTAFETLGYLNSVDEVQPRRVVRGARASREPRKLLIGVPTVLRTHDVYVHDTLSSLLNAGDRTNEILVMVAIAPVLNQTSAYHADMGTASAAQNETDSAQNAAIDAEDRLVEELATKFAEHVEAGRLELLVIPRKFYPDFNAIRWQLGDGPTRSSWRMKQALDAAYLMMYARSRGEYYLHLEDDILAKRNFAADVDAFIGAQHDDDWFVLEFSRLGFIAKLFRTRDLDFLSQFILLFFPFKPVDWLLEYLLDTMVCSPERDVAHCAAMKMRLRRTHEGSLFQHVGHFSSLDGKVQRLQDASFGKPVLFRGHHNPLAEVSSSVIPFQHFSARAVYEGVNYFWGLTPVTNDSITIQFVKPHVLSRFYIHSGNAEHPSDKCLHAVIEVRYARTSTAPSEYMQVGEFDQFGEAQSNASLERAPIGPLAAFRIRITETHTTWVIINEILIA